MAKSQYEYVKWFEQDDSMLKECWIVVRVDGKGFTKFTREHGFKKPHDASGLELMNAAAEQTMREFPGDIRVAFGESDEYSFVFDKHTTLYQRRAGKLVSLVVSCFTGHYVTLWQTFFPQRPLTKVPLFDGRAIAYPSYRTVRDYLSWRQADTHINCQYNTCYWLLMEELQDREAVQKTLRGTQTAEKNELMFQRGVNYNDLPGMYRKGTTIIWVPETDCSTLTGGSFTDPVSMQGSMETQPRERKKRKKVLRVFHEDIIRQAFWDRYPHVLEE